MQHIGVETINRETDMVAEEVGSGDLLVVLVDLGVELAIATEVDCADQRPSLALDPVEAVERLEAPLVVTDTDGDEAVQEVVEHLAVAVVQEPLVGLLGVVEDGAAAVHGGVGIIVLEDALRLDTSAADTRSRVGVVAGDRSMKAALAVELAAPTPGVLLLIASRVIRDMIGRVADVIDAAALGSGVVGGVVEDLDIGEGGAGLDDLSIEFVILGALLVLLLVLLILHIVVKLPELALLLVIVLVVALVDVLGTVGGSGEEGEGASVLGGGRGASLGAAVVADVEGVAAAEALGDQGGDPIHHLLRASVRIDKGALATFALKVEVALEEVLKDKRREAFSLFLGRGDSTRPDSRPDDNLSSVAASVK